METELTRTFGELFTFLKGTDYAWEPMTPERLVSRRKSPEAFPALERYFGLGLEVPPEELLEAGIPAGLLPRLAGIRPAISRSGGVFVPHGHWPAPNDAPEGYVYLGQESLQLIRELQPHLESFIGKNVLDLGSGAGILSFEVSALAREVIGIEASHGAVRWANAAASAQNLGNVRFHQAFIGTREADERAGGQRWDAAIFNPPMGIPTESERRLHRDGGHLGIEIPLRFLEFARRHLRAGGETFCLMTNPIVHGRNELFERIDPRAWEILDRQRLNDRFNQSLFRKEGYGGHSVQRIELWFLRLRKRA